MERNKLVDVSVIFLAFGLLFLALKEFDSFLRPFVIALILTFLFVPLTRLSTQKKKLVWVSTIGIAAAIFFITTIVTTVLVSDTSQVDEVSNIQSSESDFLVEYTQLEVGGNVIDLSDHIGPEKFTEVFTSFLSKLFSSLGSFFSELFLVILFLIFLLPSHDATIKKISSKLDSSSRRKFKNALSEIEKNIRSYLAIKATISVITAVLSAIIMFIFGVKFLFLFTFLIFALNFIPNIGSIMAVGVVLITYFLTEPFSSTFFILAVLLIMVQIIMGNLVEPQFAGKELELSPVVILLSLFFWGSVWGIGGMFFAVPFTSIIKIVLQNIDSTKKFVPYLS